MNYFGWIDFSRKDRDLARDIIASLNEPGAVDELGIGVIRDAFADYFFPGTSTIQTIAKYFFLVSYQLEDLTGIPAPDYERTLRDMEKKCSSAMWDSLSVEERRSGNSGVFGRTFFERGSGEWVKRVPSIVYWSGIRKLNLLICPNSISLAEFLRIAAAREPIPACSGRDPAENRPAGAEKSWHWCLPPPEDRGNWKEHPTVQLTPGEAQFFVKQINNILPETLFAFIAAHRRDLPEKFTDLPHLNLPPHLQEPWQLANDFSEFLKPAQIRFNCLLNNEKAEQEWSDCSGEKLRQLADAVNLDAIFGLLKLEKHYGLRKFLEALRSTYRSGSIDELDKLLFDREKFLKGEKRMKLKRGFLDGTPVRTEEKTLSLPPNAAEVLTDMAIAAPGICVLRSLHRYFPNADEKEINKAAETITDAFLRMFDSSEGIGAVADSCVDLKYYERQVLQYCVNGNFQAMFDEYCFLRKQESDSLSTAAEDICKALKLVTTPYGIHTWESTIGERQPMKMHSHYAVGYNKNTSAKDDSDTQADRRESIRTAFNSPFRPFVLASTSVGQEGLDFHYYCRRIMHWNLPHNPTELEQREGRINRYLCLAVRNSMVRHFRTLRPEAVPTDWEELLNQASAEAEKCNNPYSEITPFWCFSKDQPVKIERIVPLYPFSRDEAEYERLLKLLSLYRLTMGQARQEELLNAILERNADADPRIKELFISLCPFRKEAFA